VSSAKDLTFSATSSTRVDLAGGTLDLWPLSALIKNAATINCSIDCFTEVTFTPSDTLTITVESPDFSESFEFRSVDDFFAAEDNKLSLLQEAFPLMEDTAKAIGEWSLKSASPAGSGLGGSSSLLISILRVMCKICDLDCCDAEIIETAKNIESRVLKTPAGIQDYFAPVKKGLNFISYKECGYIREEMVEALSFIGPCLTIVDSQIKHHSGMNNWEILKSYVDGDLRVKEALESISETSHKLKEAFIKQDFEAVKNCFEDELEARKKVSTSYLNDDLIAFLEKLKLVPGAAAFKICGAGGGGCVLILHKADDKEVLVQNLKNENFSVLPFSLIGS